MVATSAEAKYSSREANNKPDAVKIARLLNTIGPDARERYNQFAWGEDEDKTKYEVVLSKFDTHFQGKKRIVFNRYKFWSAEWKEGVEFIDHFTTLQKLAAQCEFSEKDNMIRYKIIFSLNDNELKEKPLSIDDITLDSVRDKCIAAETTRKEVKQMTTGTAEEKTIEAIRRRGKKIAEEVLNQNPCRTATQNTSVVTVVPGIHQRNVLPMGRNATHVTRKTTMLKCVGAHHEKRWYIQHSMTISQESVYEIGSVLTVSNIVKTRQAWFEAVEVAGTQFKFKVDTGAETNLISYKAWKKVASRPKLTKSKVTLQTLDGSKIQHYGSARVTFKVKDMQTEAEIFVTKQQNGPILVYIQLQS
ncbi:uncharacterized protein [Ptychodera flava]|uniref:uncharacterized protein n=1 Tax=Ptychodera flava TaxID=63121 RepID=UPI00396A7908